MTRLLLVTMFALFVLVACGSNESFEEGPILCQVDARACTAQGEPRLPSAPVRTYDSGRARCHVTHYRTQWPRSSGPRVVICIDRVTDSRYCIDGGRQNEPPKWSQPCEVAAAAVEDWLFGYRDE